MQTRNVFFFCCFFREISTIIPSHPRVLPSTLPSFAYAVFRPDSRFVLFPAEPRFTKAWLGPWLFHFFFVSEKSSNHLSSFAMAIRGCTAVPHNWVSRDKNWHILNILLKEIKDVQGPQPTYGKRLWECFFLTEKQLYHPLQKQLLKKKNNISISALDKQALGILFLHGCKWHQSRDRTSAFQFFQLNEEAEKQTAGPQRRSRGFWD